MVLVRKAFKVPLKITEHGKEPDITYVTGCDYVVVEYGVDYAIVVVVAPNNSIMAKHNYEEVEDVYKRPLVQKGTVNADGTLETITDEA